MATTASSVVHVHIETALGFDDVTRAFVRQLGTFQPETLRTLVAGKASADELRSAVDAMAGASGLMLFGTIDHGGLLAALGIPRRVVQYTVGNPIVASSMTQWRSAAGLYAPLRVLVAGEDDGQTSVEYDRPSSLFGRFGDERIDEVARELDRKLESLVEACIKA